MGYSLIAIVILLTVDIMIYNDSGKIFFTPNFKYIRKLSYAFFVLYIIATGVFNESQFIYFQF